MASAVPDVKLLAVFGVRSAPYERDLWMGPVRWTVNGASGMKLLPSALTCVWRGFFRACVRVCASACVQDVCVRAHVCGRIHVRRRVGVRTLHVCNCTRQGVCVCVHGSGSRAAAVHWI